MTDKEYMKSHAPTSVFEFLQEIGDLFKKEDFNPAEYVCTVFGFSKSTSNPIYQTLIHHIDKLTQTTGRLSKGFTNEQLILFPILSKHIEKSLEELNRENNRHHVNNIYLNEFINKLENITYKIFIESFEEKINKNHSESSLIDKIIELTNSLKKFSTTPISKDSFSYDNAILKLFNAIHQQLDAISISNENLKKYYEILIELLRLSKEITKKNYISKRNFLNPDLQIFIDSLSIITEKIQTRLNNFEEKPYTSAVTLFGKKPDETFTFKLTLYPTGTPKSIPVTLADTARP